MTHNPHIAYQLARTLVDDMHREAFSGGAKTRRRTRRRRLRSAARKLVAVTHPAMPTARQLRDG